MDKHQVKVVSCGAVPWRERDGQVQVLLIKQFPNKEAWSIPKGHLRDGETVEECAVREVREETGVTVLLSSRLPNTTVNIKNGTKTVVSFLGTLIGEQEPRLDDPECEVVDARWFNIEALPEIQYYQRDLMTTAVAEIRGILSVGGNPPV